MEQVRLAGRLRDVGRIGVREAVLNKAGTLTDEELEHIREHLLIGVEILAPLEHLGPVITFVQDHHERWDGAGYPRRLRGAEISIGGRILAAADAFNALTSLRPHREPITPERAAHLDKLASQVANGDYHVDAKVVSSKIIDDTLRGLG